MLTLLKKFLWTVPFICFLAGYIFLMKLYPIKEIKTPRVLGKTLQDACSLLAQHSLNARLVATKEDALLADGTIISQTPLANQKIKPNQTVFIVASKKPEKTYAANYTNKSISEIEQELTRKNIRAKIYFVPSNLQKDICIAQWPESGTPLEDNKIILYIGATNNKPHIIPNLKHRNALETVNFLKSNNVLIDVCNTSYDPKENHLCPNCIIKDQRPLAGSILTFDTQKPLQMQLQIAHP